MRLRGGVEGSATRSSIAREATTAISRQGWCIVVRMITFADELAIAKEIETLALI
jgi:hypothetical protein